MRWFYDNSVQNVSMFVRQNFRCTIARMFAASEGSFSEKINTLSMYQMAMPLISVRFHLLK